MNNQHEYGQQAHSKANAFDNSQKPHEIRNTVYYHQEANKESNKASCKCQSKSGMYIIILYLQHVKCEHGLCVLKKKIRNHNTCELKEGKQDFC